MTKFNEPILVTKAFLPPIEEYKQYLDKIWDSHWLTNNGPLHNELEKKIEKYLKVPHSVLFTNGHLALDVAIKALNLTGEVITTPFTFASTTHAIVMNNLKPVFCDINMDDFTIDVDKIEELITENTSAIIAVHVFGYPCAVQAIERIAKKHELKVIYDAAHVFGVEVNGKGIGTFGDVSMFSLHATKVFNSIEGGVLSFNDTIYRHSFNSYKNFGITGPETIEQVGLNAKMNEFQAAMGLINLEYIDDQICKRKKVADIYRRSLQEIEGISYLDDKPGVKHNYSYFPIIIDEHKLGISRDELFSQLQLYNIFTRKYFYPLTPNFECYEGKYATDHLINAKYIADRILTLPIYGDLELLDAQKIANIIINIVNSSKTE